MLNISEFLVVLVETADLFTNFDMLSTDGLLLWGSCKRKFLVCHCIVHLTGPKPAIWKEKMGHLRYNLSSRVIIQHDGSSASDID